MKLLVTGGRGLVGSSITAEFKPTRDELDMIVSDENYNKAIENIHVPYDTTR
jgi:UDP-glucose 4-epimerase